MLAFDSIRSVPALPPAHSSPGETIVGDPSICIPDGLFGTVVLRSISHVPVHTYESNNVMLIRH